MKVVIGFGIESKNAMYTKAEIIFVFFFTRDFFYPLSEEEVINMTKEKKYLIFTSLQETAKFVEKLDAQNVGHEMTVGTYPELWIKISYEDGYKPF